MHVLERKSTRLYRTRESASAKKNADPGRDQQVSPLQAGTVPMRVTSISSPVGRQLTGHLCKVGRAYHPAHKVQQRGAADIEILVEEAVPANPPPNPFALINGEFAC